jgi:hypothetical protein
MKPFFLTAVVFVFGLFVLTPYSHALTISPVRVEVQGDPGQTLRGEMEMLNEQGEPKVFFSSFENFEPAGDTGSPRFIGAKDGLATWLKTDNNVSIGVGEKKVIPYTITIPSDAEPGGYFAAIFWGGQDPTTQVAGEVAIGGKLGVLILLRVRGDIVESAGVSEYGTQDASRFFSSTPVAFSYRFTNQGGDRVVPLGEIVIENTFGATAATLKANENEGNVLPGSSRKFSPVWGEAAVGTSTLSFMGTLKKQITDFHFGMYTANLRLVYGATNQTSADSFIFFIIPWQLCIVVFAVLVALYFLLKQYNKMIIAKSNKKN